MDFTNKSVLGWGNRGWLEIIDLILMVCERGALKTHIMYKCNLNSKQIQQYVEFLLSRQLITKTIENDEPKRTIYTTTERGKRFMEAYDELAGIFNTRESSLQR